MKNCLIIKSIYNEHDDSEIGFRDYYTTVIEFKLLKAVINVLYIPRLSTIGLQLLHNISFCFIVHLLIIIIN